MTDRASRWGLRLLAIVGAMVVWWLASVEQRERISERVVDASVSYNSPPGMILLDPIQTVKVRMRGPDSRVRRIAAGELDVVVDIDAGAPGTRVILLGSTNVLAPEEVDVTSIEPNSLAVRVDREVTAQLPVVPRLIGDPVAGTVVGTAKARPETVRVSGPAGVVTGLTAVSTSAISLDGHALTFSQTVSVVSPDPLVRIVEPPFVTVLVPVNSPDTTVVDEPQPPAKHDRNR